MDRSNPSTSVVERFSEMPSQDFGDEIRSLWESGSKVIDTVIEQVENGPVTPVQGLGIIGCTTAQLYGYNAFHGEASSADLVSALSSGTLSGARG